MLLMMLDDSGGHTNRRDPNRNIPNDHSTRSDDGVSADLNAIDDRGASMHVATFPQRDVAGGHNAGIDLATTAQHTMVIDLDAGIDYHTGLNLRFVANDAFVTVG